MAIVSLTSDQRVNLENNTRFQDLVRIAILNQSNYWRGQDGTNPPGSDHIRWAKSRFIATGIVLYPTSQDYASWARQFIIILKDMLVYDDSQQYSEDLVLDYMLANSKFDELADLTFNLRILKVEF